MLTRPNAMRKPIHHQRGVRRARTIELILSVTVAKVWPGAITGGVVPVCASAATSCTQVGIHVSQCREIGRAGPRIELAEQGVVARFALQPRDPAARIVQIPEDDGVGWTC